MLTPYQFASNRPIDGIDLDGLEYVYYLRSPLLSKKVVTAYNQNDLNEERRILNWASNNTFSPESRPNVAGQIRMSSYQDGDKVGYLDYDPNAPDGFTLVTYEWKGKGQIAPQDPEKWLYFPLNDCFGPEDKYFPTDVREGHGYYGDNDFIGIYGGSEIMGGGYGDGAGFITGHIRGWGYYEFKTEVINNATGLGGGISGGEIKGKATKSKYLNPTYLIGAGNETGGGYIFFEIGTWNSIEGDEKTWEGNYKGIGVSFDIIPLSPKSVKTGTQQIFPQIMNDENK